MDSASILERASGHLLNLSGHVFDLLTITKPVSPEAALNLSKVISKLSPLLGNMIEFNTVEYLNDQKEFSPFGTWKRQDPGFPDAIFEGEVFPRPGFEIKAWFPLSTEITARFKDSQKHFQHDETKVCMLAWLPEYLIFGKPRIIDVCVVSGQSVALARDRHYHNPPDYLVIEPRDTSTRTRNLQQTNTAGYKWQGNKQQFDEAEKIVASWGQHGQRYLPTPEYQDLVSDLMGRFPYRLDTNFAKMDRIGHPGIEKFKERVLRYEIHGLSIGAWNRTLYRSSETDIREILKERFSITEVDTDNLLQ